MHSRSVGTKIQETEHEKKREKKKERTDLVTNLKEEKLRDC
jgi:hypothetical protein